MQNNENDYKGAEREERKKNKKKIVLRSKKEFCKGSFIYDIRNIHKHPMLV